MKIERIEFHSNLQRKITFPLQPLEDCKRRGLQMQMQMGARPANGSNTLNNSCGYLQCFFSYHKTFFAESTGWFFYAGVVVGDDH